VWGKKNAKTGARGSGGVTISPKKPEKREVSPWDGGGRICLEEDGKGTEEGGKRVCQTEARRECLI